jgi:hypothetical protein
MTGVVSELIKDVALPDMYLVEQKFPAAHIPIEQIPAIVRREVLKANSRRMIRTGQRVAITVGSRGVANIALLIKSIVDTCKELGALPFIVPAMGSHGGAIAENQTEIIRRLGVTEEYCGCPIVSSMETVKIGVNDWGGDVCIDKNAAAADAIIVAARVKLHTGFRGPYESGLMKMMTIGLGKQHGAEICHSYGFQHFAELIPMIGRCILRNAPVAMGIAFIDNAYQQTYKIVGLTPEGIIKEEPVLLEEAKKMMARIYLDSCDMLVVDKIGKNYAGDGMDPNITGTWATPYASGGLKCKNIALLDISDESHGNASGMGAGHAISRRFYEKIDVAATYPNCITATALNVARIPLIMDNDKEAIQVCIKASSDIGPEGVRLIRIANTLELDRIRISAALLQEAEKIPQLKVIGGPEPRSFDANGNLW